MSADFKVAVLIGSLRKGSITRKLAHALIQNAPAALRCEIVEIGNLPLYDEDKEGRTPAWTRFRKAIAATDAVLFVTPEYNRSVPGCLKNAIDVGSRPEGKSIWDGKPAGVVSVTPYKLGAFGANHAIRQTFVFLNMPVMQQPEAYIGNAASLFSKNGVLHDTKTKSFLTQFMAAFETWVAKFAVEAESAGFEEFMQTRAVAATAYVNGDTAPLDALSIQTGDATFFPPNGGHVASAGKVTARYNADAKAFSPRGTTRFKVLQKGASGDLAFWTGLQSAEAKIGGKRVKMKLRITELFRRERGEWKLIHRHADPAAEPQRKPK